jgi:saccharopine dehydrogenase-like NADP-dependent oxidoreductase
MRQPVRFGVVGGYGATGRVVVSELWHSGAGEILVGGRHPEKAKALAAQFDGRVAAAHLDVSDARSLKPPTMLQNCLP